MFDPTSISIAMTRKIDQILSDIETFTPENGVWLKLEELLGELWIVGVGEEALPSLFRVFERFPDEDGLGVLWSIIHGVEALPLDYERALRASLARQPSEMGRVMLDRLLRSRKA